MAVPSNARILRGAPLKGGVMLGVSPSSDPTFDMEIARATSSGVYDTVARLTAKGSGIPVSYTDILPVDGFSRSYKARAVKDGWDPSAYTAVVSAKPVYLPEIAPNITPLTGQTVGAPLFISTGAPPKYGKANLQQYYDVPLDVYPFEFNTTANSVVYNANERRIFPTSVLTATAFYWKSVIPSGSSVGTVDLYYRRAGILGSLRFRVQTFSASTITVTLLDYTATGTSGSFTKSFTSGFGVGNVPLFARVDITSTIGSTASVQLNRISFQYKKPNVGVAV